MTLLSQKNVFLILAANQNCCGDISNCYNNNMIPQQLQFSPQQFWFAEDLLTFFLSREQSHFLREFNAK